MLGQNRDFNKSMNIKYVWLLFVLKCYINFEQNVVVVYVYIFTSVVCLFT
jgi:hypothetical protein